MGLPGRGGGTRIPAGHRAAVREARGVGGRSCDYRGEGALGTQGHEHTGCREDVGYREVRWCSRALQVQPGVGGALGVAEVQGRLVGAVWGAGRSSGVQRMEVGSLWGTEGCRGCGQGTEGCGGCDSEPGRGQAGDAGGACGAQGHAGGAGPVPRRGRGARTHQGLLLGEPGLGRDEAQRGGVGMLVHLAEVVLQDLQLLLSGSHWLLRGHLLLGQGYGARHCGEGPVSLPKLGVARAEPQFAIPVPTSSPLPSGLWPQQGIAPFPKACR